MRVSSVTWPSPLWYGAIGLAVRQSWCHGPTMPCTRPPCRSTICSGVQPSTGPPSASPTAAPTSAPVILSSRVGVGSIVMVRSFLGVGSGSGPGRGEFRTGEQGGELDEVGARQAGSAQPERVRQASRQAAGMESPPPSTPVRAPARAGAESATRDRQAAAGTASQTRPRAAVARARATGTVSAAAIP